MFKNVDIVTQLRKEQNFLSRLNSVRFFVIFIMMFGYASTMSLGPGHQESLALYGYDPSWHAIQVLFFLSGILAYRSIENGKTGFTYLWSRFSRNIPLLGFLTIAILFILFPLFGTPNDSGTDFWKRITKYILLTAFCIDPSMRIQGLMDDAKYMCLVQGAIWTLRIGIILHIAVVISHFPKLFSKRILILAGTITVTIGYALLGYLFAKKGIETLESVLTLLRLSYAFGIGLCVWAYRDFLLNLKARIFILPVIFFLIASLNFWFFRWTTLIEVSSTLVFISLSWALLVTRHKYLDLLKDWKNVTMIMMAIGWPITQTLLLIHPDLGRWTLPLVALPTIVALTYITHWSLQKSAEFSATRRFVLARTS